jgi:hypothetical protein
MVSLPFHETLMMLDDVRVTILQNKHMYRDRKDMIMETIQGNVEPFMNSLELHYQ